MDLPNLKVKLRCTGLNATRHSIIRMLGEHAISCSKVLRINENLLILFCNSLRDIDRIFCDDLCDEFGKLDCEPIPPPDLQAKRSFIVKSVDPVIYGEEVEVIAAELGNKNPWLVVKSVYRFNKSKTLKVTCSNQEMVNIALRQGVKLFQLSINPNNLAPERFVDIMVCYKCYQWNDHLARSCAKDDNYKVCSLCSSNSHTFKECKSSERKCVNCGGGHSTVSFACSVRKNIAKQIRSREAIGEKISPQPVAFVPSVKHDNNISDIASKSTMCVVIAAMKHHSSGEEFNVTLNQLLAANKLPSFNMGGVEPPVVLPKHVMNLTDKDEPRENVLGVDEIIDQQTVCSIATPKYSAFPVNFSNNNKDTSTAKNKEAPGLSRLSEFPGLPGTGAGEKCDVVPVVNSPVAAAVKKFSSTHHASHSTKEQQRKRNTRNNSKQTTH